MKSALVTGANAGIGRETARQLLQLGWRVFVHGRSQQKAERAANELAHAAGCGTAEAVSGDLSDMRAVVALAHQVKEKTASLDVLLNNAGVYEHERRLTCDGLETTMAVNHFAPFLLTFKLLHCLQAATQGRVVTVSSAAHQGAKLEVKDLTFARGYHAYTAYASSKLANILFTAALAKRFVGTSVSANCLHPGVIATKLLHKGWGAGGAPIEEGARTSVYLASADAVSNINGGYFIDCHQAAPSRVAQDAQLAQALWEATVDLLRPYLHEAEFTRA